MAVPEDKFCVWDRQFGVLLHQYGYWGRGGALASVDISRSSPALVFATGSFSGDVVLYRTSEGDETSGEKAMEIEGVSGSFRTIVDEGAVQDVSAEVLSGAT